MAVEGQRKAGQNRHDIITKQDHSRRAKRNSMDMDEAYAPETSHLGYVDTLDDDLILYGWACDRAAPATRLDIEILVNDVVQDRLTANLLRPDVQEAGLGDGQYGFAWPLPLAKLSFPGPLILTARITGTTTRLTNSVTFPQADDPWQSLKWANELRAAGTLEPARALLHNLVTQHPDFWHAHISLGDIEAEAGNYPAAEHWFQQAIKQAPNTPEPRLSLINLLRSQAQTAREAGQYQQAAALCARAWAQAPENPALMAELARDYARLGQQQDSNRLLLAALDRDPAQPDAVTQLASQALTVGNAAQAYKIYHEAAAHRPDEQAFYFGMVDALAWQGQIPKALAALATIADKFGASPQATLWHITLLRRIGNMNAALSIARGANLAAPTQFWIWMERFQTELLAGSDAMLVKSLLGSPARSPSERALEHRCAGMLAEAFWQLDAACRAYEDSAALNAEDPSTQEALARVKLMQMDLVGARAHLKSHYDLTGKDRRLRGQSLNLSQSLLGQMIEEYALDATLAAKLADLRATPAPQRLSAMAALVQQNPDATAPAANLLLALREAEQLPFIPVSDQRLIPPQITMFWHDPKRPDDIDALMQSWRAHHPSYAWRCFDETQAQAYLNSLYPPPVIQAYQRIKEKSQKADLFRLALLVAEGGVYADADDRCLRPLDDLLSHGANLVLAQELFGCVGNHFIAAQKNHPVLKLALDTLVEALNRGDNEIPWLLSGPGALTRAFAQWLVSQSTFPTGLRILDQRALGYYVAASCFATYKIPQTRQHQRIETATQTKS